MFRFQVFCFWREALSFIFSLRIGKMGKVFLFWTGIAYVGHVMAGSITIQNLIDSCLAIHKFRKQKAKIGLEKLSGEAAKTFNHFSEWSERQKFPPAPTQPHVSITIISNYASTRASIQINDVIHILSSYTVLSSSLQNRFVERRCMWSNYKYHYIVRQFMFSSLCSASPSLSLLWYAVCLCCSV